MWPFSKQSRPLDLPSEGQHWWSVAQGDCEGAPLIVRCNQTAGDWVGHPGLPVKLGFAIPLIHPNQGGLPNSEENGELGTIEDLISQEVLSKTRGVHALTLTTGMMKELVFYIAPGADIAKLHESIQNQVTSHDVQCMAVEEPNWESYRAIVPLFLLPRGPRLVRGGSALFAHRHLHGGRIQGPQTRSTLRVRTVRLFKLVYATARLRARVGTATR
jgi:hypothetical protein